MTETKNMHQRFLEVQKNIGPAYTTRKGHVGSHKYIELGALLDLVKPALHSEGLYLTQVHRAGGLVTKIVDSESGMDVVTADFTFPQVPGRNAIQELGSFTTYARRYSLLAALGMEDEDDDGQSCTQPRKAEALPVIPTPKQENCPMPAPKGEIEANNAPHPDEIELLAPKHKTAVLMQLAEYKKAATAQFTSCLKEFTNGHSSFKPYVNTQQDLEALEKVAKSHGLEVIIAAP